MMNKIMKYATAVLFGVLMASNTAQAGEAEVKICIETLNELAGGNPPVAAVKLCEQGKTEAALEAAMNADG